MVKINVVYITSENYSTIHICISKNTHIIKANTFNLKRTQACFNIPLVSNNIRTNIFNTTTHLVYRDNFFQ